MDILKMLKKHKSDILKISGLLLLLLIVVSVAASFGFPADFGLRRGVSVTQKAGGVPSASPVYYDEAVESYAPGFAGEVARDIGGPIPPIVPEPIPTPGADAEEYEVTEYSAYIETRDLEDSCAVISGLKARDDVIFESANEYDKGCSYFFKVENDSAQGVLAIIEGLDPKDLSENTRTIKRVVEDLTSEEEILQRKMETIESTLEDVVTAYDSIVDLATDLDDVETLANVIDSKIRTIESLTQQRIAVAERLDRIARAKAEQLDRLEYTLFYVDIVEDKYIDAEDIRDSWKDAVQRFVDNVNIVAQGVSITLIALLLYTLQFAVYFFLLLFIVKYVWKWAKNIWKK